MHQTQLPQALILSENRDDIINRSGGDSFIYITNYLDMEV